MIENFESGLKLGSIVFQSNGTSKIISKIRNIINLFKKIGPNNFYDEYGFILYEVQIGDYYLIVLFSSECFSDSILKQGVPLLFGEEKSNMSTQCGPTVTGIQKEILGNNKLNRIITIDNYMDVSIKTKSIRGQLLLKLFYLKDSSFLTPESYGNNGYILPIDNKIKF